MTESDHLTIALFQTQGVPGNVEANLELMARTARRAAGLGCDLLIFPELFLTGYNIGKALVRMAQPPDGPAARKVRRLAREHRIAILFGYPELGENRIFNSAICIGADGKICANYRKTHLYGAEKQQFAPGEKLLITRIGPLQVGILICYDVEFNGAVTALARAGAHLVAVPTALMHPYRQVAHSVVPARAYDHQLYIAYANRCGREGELAYCGSSCVVGPDGVDLARASEEDPELITARIEKDIIGMVRRRNPLVSDVRPALYRQAVTGVR